MLARSIRKVTDAVPSSVKMTLTLFSRLQRERLVPPTLNPARIHDPAQLLVAERGGHWPKAALCGARKAGVVASWSHGERS